MRLLILYHQKKPYTVQKSHICVLNNKKITVYTEVQRKVEHGYTTAILSYTETAKVFFNYTA